MSIQDKIKQQVTDNEIVLYMKGNAEMPMCGFSAVVAKVLDTLHVPFKGINVLDDSGIREGIKAYANWPTIPQLYIKGEFIGGSDIVREMYQSGELQALLKEKGITVS